MSITVETATEIRSFQIEVPQEQIDDLRRRVAATRWPTNELVADRSQGVQLATLPEVARYWTARPRDGGFSARRREVRRSRTEVLGHATSDVTVGRST